MLHKWGRKLPLAAAMAVLLVALAACGSGASNSASTMEDSTPASQEVVVKATNYKFDQQTYEVKKGEPVRIKVETDGIHGIKVANTDIALKAGQSKVYTINDAGEYEIVCSIPCGPGHEKMRAVLKVQ
ncbi:cytochrome C oxidase subunit II [Paenibacillus sp. D51F]